MFRNKFLFAVTLAPVLFGAQICVPTIAHAVDFPSGGGANVGGANVGGAGGGGAARATGAPMGQQFISDYGQIQNVQSYSSNPWWSPDSPYNQRFPVPIYAQGTELNAAQCRAMVSGVVAQQCAMRNNCRGLRLIDIRPAVVVALSNMDGHNYVTSCGGFIDAAFNDYMANVSNLGPAPTGFPTPGAAPAPGAGQIQIANPYDVVANRPIWYQDIVDRVVETDALKAQNNPTPTLVATKMPGTISDVDFQTRMQNEAAGLAPYANLHAYQQQKIQDDAGAWQDRALAATEKQKALKAECDVMQMTLPKEEYCERCGLVDPTSCKPPEKEKKDDCAAEVAAANADAIKKACDGKPVGTKVDCSQYDPTKCPEKIFGTPVSIECGKDDSVKPKPDYDKIFETILPWYGILVVKKHSLDFVTAKDLPVISTDYMKMNSDIFYPANSGNMSAWNPIPTFTGKASGCTYGSHTANDNDVVNRAAHRTFDEEDSFFTGNDYYVYDGKDVYWGTAQLIGQVALTILTFGVGTGAVAAAEGAQSAAVVANAGNVVRAATVGGRALVTSADLVNDANVLREAAQAGRAVKTTTEILRARGLVPATASAAEKASALAESNALKAAATAKFSAAGIQANGTAVRTFNQIGMAVETHAVNALATMGRPGFGAVATEFISGMARPWRLTTWKNGLSVFNPVKIVAKTPGIRNLQGIRKGLAIATVGAAEGGIVVGLAKAFGYSSSSAAYDGVKFNSFGLLSGDDLEGRDNVVSHGAWIQIEYVNSDPDANLGEALKFAQAFKEDVDSFNQGGECDIDIYVVQVGITNPAKNNGKHETQYMLLSEPVSDNLRVDGKPK